MYFFCKSTQKTPIYQFFSAALYKHTFSPYKISSPRTYYLFNFSPFAVHFDL